MVLLVALSACLAFAPIAASTSIPWDALSKRQQCYLPALNGDPDPCCFAASPDATYCAAFGQPRNTGCNTTAVDFTYCWGPNDPRDPEDLSDITMVAAIGDSYAAGIGAGNLLDSSCYRYDGGYPSVLNADPRFGDPAGRTFTNLACSGAKTPDVIAQANALPAGQQVITISAGGNDALLINVLNDCIYNFYGGFGGDCEGTIATVEEILDSDDFAASLLSTIQAAQAKLAPLGNIFYTGYAQFFDDSTNDCDTVSWHFWINIWSRQYLTQARRTMMNNLVVLINEKIAAAVEKAGSDVTFVDYNPYFILMQGLYCQPGIDEYHGANRNGLLFYEMQTTDTPWGLHVWDATDLGSNDKRSLRNSIADPDVTRRETLAPRQNINDTDPRNVAEEVNADVMLTFSQFPNATLDPAIIPADIVPFLQSEGVAVQKRINFIPASWARAFHPQQGGHLLIANLIMARLVSYRYFGLAIHPPEEDLQAAAVGTCSA